MTMERIELSQMTNGPAITDGNIGLRRVLNTVQHPKFPECLGQNSRLTAVGKY